MTIEHWFEFGGILAAILAGGLISGYKVAKVRGMKLLEKRKKEEFPSSFYWSTHTHIHESLTELRVNTDCARAQVVQFHNGGYFLDGISMKKMSLTHESLAPGVSSEMGIKKDLLLSMCIDGLNLLMINEPKLHITDSLEDSWCKQLLQNSNVVSFSFLPLKRKNLIIGYVMCQWCSWTKTDEIDEDFISENIKDARKRLEIQLDLELRDKQITKKDK